MDPQGRKWCFTLNNYTEDELNAYIQLLDSRSQYVIGKEVGEEGTPHLQGYFECKSPKKFSMVKRWLGDRAHIEKAKGSQEQNYKYCTKDGEFVTNIDNRSPQEVEDAAILEEEYGDVVWKDWQTQIIGLLSSVPSRRLIHWFYDRKGNTGKSFLCKYLMIKFDVIIVDGKKADVFNQVKTMVEGGKFPRIILVDIPRHNVEYVNYGVLEALKNGAIYSGKYEGGQIRFRCPHIVCFANEKPEADKLSADRWVIEKIR